MIKRIYNDDSCYEVGKDDVKAIELTDHGNKETTIYKLTYDNEEILYVGLLEHEVEIEKIEEQMTIFEYL